MVKTNKSFKVNVLSPFSFLPTSGVIQILSWNAVLHPEGVYVILDGNWVLELVGRPVHVIGDQMVIIDLVGVAGFD